MAGEKDLSSQDLYEGSVTSDEPVQQELPLEPERTEPEPAPVVDQGESIPSWRLREEAEARRSAESRAQALEARLNEIATHLRQGQKKPDFFDNPDAATQELVTKALQPYAEETRRTLMYLGKMAASQAHGQDKVDEAEKAFLDARTAETLDPADYERVVQSPNRYDAVVQWHKRQSVLASVGDDPSAWFEKQLEAKLADPKFQAALLDKVQKGVSSAGKPTTVRLPPSLSRSTAAASNGNEVVGDLSDQSLFAHATRS